MDGYPPPLNGASLGRGITAPTTSDRPNLLEGNGQTLAENPPPETQVIPIRVEIVINSKSKGINVAKKHHQLLALLQATDPHLQWSSHDDKQANNNLEEFPSTQQAYETAYPNGTSFHVRHDRGKNTTTLSIVQKIDSTKTFDELKSEPKTFNFLETNNIYFKHNTIKEARIVPIGWVVGVCPTGVHRDSYKAEITQAILAELTDDEGQALTKNSGSSVLEAINIQLIVKDKGIGSKAQKDRVETEAIELLAGATDAPIYIEVLRRLGPNGNGKFPRGKIQPPVFTNEKARETMRLAIMKQQQFLHNHVQILAYNLSPALLHWQVPPNPVTGPDPHTYYQYLKELKGVTGIEWSNTTEENGKLYIITTKNEVDNVSRLIDLSFEDVAKEGTACAIIKQSGLAPPYRYGYKKPPSDEYTDWCNAAHKSLEEDDTVHQQDIPRKKITRSKRRKDLVFDLNGPDFPKPGPTKAGPKPNKQETNNTQPKTQPQTFAAAVNQSSLESSLEGNIDKLFGKMMNGVETMIAKGLAKGLEQIEAKLEQRMEEMVESYIAKLTQNDHGHEAAPAPAAAPTLRQVKFTTPLVNNATIPTQFDKAAVDPAHLKRPDPDPPSRTTLMTTQQDGDPDGGPFTVYQRKKHKRGNPNFPKLWAEKFGSPPPT